MFPTIVGALPLTLQPPPPPHRPFTSKLSLIDIQYDKKNPFFSSVWICIYKFHCILTPTRKKIRRDNNMCCTLDLTDDHHTNQFWRAYSPYPPPLPPHKNRTSFQISIFIILLKQNKEKLKKIPKYIKRFSWNELAFSFNAFHYHWHINENTTHTHTHTRVGCIPSSIIGLLIAMSYFIANVPMNTGNDVRILVIMCQT